MAGTSAGEATLFCGRLCPAMTNKGMSRSGSGGATRAVQAGFVLALLGAWYAATNYGGISAILLPNPVAVWYELVDVVTSGDFIEDLRVTLTELLVAFAISATLGVTLGYLISRSQ